jgi:hypothetical protein
MTPTSTVGNMISSSATFGSAGTEGGGGLAGASYCCLDEGVIGAEMGLTATGCVWGPEGEDMVSVERQSYSLMM